MGSLEMYPEAYAEYVTGDPAYDKAFVILADCPSFAQVEQTLKAYAHELAEKIRDWDNTYGPFTAQVAADEIDPEVST